MIKTVLVTIVAAILLTLSLTACDPAPSAANPCAATSARPGRYEHVVIMMNENRRWSEIGLGFNASNMPYLHGLATKCAYYSHWTETNTHQNSLTQYIGMTSGVDNPRTVNDCRPSSTCNSLDNNIFRQVRVAGKTPRSYVEGATTGCSASGNAPKHIPALYYWGGTDRNFCNAEVRPFTELNVDALPTFSYITPNQCHDGHDCDDQTVDDFARTTLTRILNGKTYAAGKTLVVVGYDEDKEVPNLLIAPTAHAGVISSPNGSHASLLKTIELALGLPVMNQGQLPSAIDLRPSANL